jgi:translation initiation factor IF-2
LVGAAVGALVAALVARNQFVGVRRDYRTQLRRRDLALERLKKELEEDRSDYRQRSDDYLRELAALKRERSSLSSELEETRRTLATLQSNLETLRASARDAEFRLSTALDSAREEAAARRASAAEELTTVKEAADRARSELSRRVADLENDRSRLETDLAAERRTNAERQEALRSILTTLREQYSLASTERDTLSRELEEERARADAAEAELRRERDEHSRRLDSEHQESLELISRVWEYVHSYMRGRPADFSPEAEPPMGVPSERPTERGAAPAAEPPPSEPLTTDREVETPRARTMGDRCPVDDYDIERALEETLPPEPKPAAEQRPLEPKPTPEPRPPEPATPASQQLSERGWRSVPPPAPESTRVRRPISAMRRGDDVLVVCDDGSVWLRRPTGWIEEPPIPGSDANGEKGPSHRGGEAPPA